jgi:hypothetical protein
MLFDLDFVPNLSCAGVVLGRCFPICEKGSQQESNKTNTYDAIRNF